MKQSDVLSARGRAEGCPFWSDDVGLREAMGDKRRQLWYLVTAGRGWMQIDDKCRDVTDRVVYNDFVLFGACI